jgi:hypothetical protein
MRHASSLLPSHTLVAVAGQKRLDLFERAPSLAGWAHEMSHLAAPIDEPEPRCRRAGASFCMRFTKKPGRGDASRVSLSGSVLMLAESRVPDHRR